MSWLTQGIDEYLPPILFSRVNVSVRREYEPLGRSHHRGLSLQLAIHVRIAYCTCSIHRMSILQFCRLRRIDSFSDNNI